MYVQVCENLFTPHGPIGHFKVVEHNQTKNYTLKKYFRGIRVLGFLCTGLSTCAHIFVLHTHSLFIIFVRDEKKNEKTRRNLVP